MQRFSKDIIAMVKDLFLTKNGPIILLQIENEFGNVQNYYQGGQDYIDWAVNSALAITNDIPWFVCQQDNVKHVINGCNGFYCDDWISKRPFKDQPAFWVENWTGWYQKWGESAPTRPAADLVFATAKFIAKGGTYVGYYMWHGGTNFGRSSGSGINAGPGFTTSYDYDAPLDEYGFKSEPKYSLLQKFHQIILENKENILNEPLKVTKLEESVYIYSYGNLSFIFNEDETTDKSMDVYGYLPKWSVSLLVNDLVIFNSFTNVGTSNRNTYEAVENFKPTSFKHYLEPVGPGDNDVVHDENPLDHFTITKDASDYLWYEAIVHNDNSTLSRLLIEMAQAHVILFVDGQFVASEVGGKNLRFQYQTFAETYRIQILVQTMGLPNYGAYYDRIPSGITGRVTINNKHIQGWNHKKGLIGETKNLYEPSAETWHHLMYPLLNVDSAKFRPQVESKGLVWHRITFPPFKIRNGYFALDMSAMTKGQLYFNGVHLGRYWNVKGTRAEDPPEAFSTSSCDYAGIFCCNLGVFSPVNCRFKVGESSQRYYYVPLPVLKTDEENIVVIFEEIGGDVSGIQLVQVFRQ
jgi:hypothetical protein